MGEAQLFLSEFLQCFGIDPKEAKFEHHPKQGSKDRIDMLLPGKLLVEMKSAKKDIIGALNQAERYNGMLQRSDQPDFLLACNFQGWRLLDKRDNSEYPFNIHWLVENIGLFYFLLGKPIFVKTDPVNEKATKIMSQIHESLKKDTEKSGEGAIDFLLTRLAFCLFADNTGIFETNSFQEYIKNVKNGSDVRMNLERLFEILDTPKEKRSKSIRERFNKFQYIDGDLFNMKKMNFDNPKVKMRIPEFTDKTRELLIKAGEYDWSKVSPAIFGSMFQNVISENDKKTNRDSRREMGAHYTTEENIRKVIVPLFLKDLNHEFNKINESNSQDKLTKYKELRDKMSKLTFFDPACGSGNFLSITYKELRRLEMRIITEMRIINPKTKIESKLDVHQFYGIEINRFSSKIAEVSIWMMDHLMNRELSVQFELPAYRFPLEKKPHIHNVDALGVNWNDILPSDKCDYILGNPPFGGYATISEEQKIRIASLYSKYDIKDVNKLDFVCGWFIKSGEYCNDKNNTKIGLVSTNSITQGEQVYPLWTILLDKLQLYINFAYKSFPWSSETKEFMRKSF